MQLIDNQKKIEQIKWSAATRLRFIEGRLYWVGHINRSTLRDKFDISTPQASADIALYMGIAPKNIYYDKVRKTYAATEEFVPEFYQPTSQDFFSQLQQIGKATLPIEHSIMGYWPEFVSFSVPQRLVKPQILRAIVNAIQAKQKIEVFYESFSQDEISWRWISPHAIAFANDRWVLRCFCHKKGLFRDFVLGRITETKSSEPTDINPATDANWHSVETLVFQPNPALLPTQRKIVENDFDMTDGKLILSVRRCLLYYIYHNLGFHKPETSEGKSDAVDKLVLENRDKIESIIFTEQNLNYPHKIN